MLDSAAFRARMPLVLLVPGLLDVAPEALAACAPLSRLAARNTPRAADDAEAALLQALDLDVAAAPLAALGAGLDVGGDWVARADPIATEVGHDDVRIVARVDDLDAREADALRTQLDGHFADDGLAFAAPRPDAWFVRSTTPHAIDTVPLAAAIDRPLRTRLPSGADAKRWRRWWTEIQMLLHEHPLAQREASRVNALWFSAAGTLPSSVAPLHAFASDTRHGDVVRGLARVAGTPTLPLAAVAPHLAGATPVGRNVIVADPVVDAEALQRFATSLLQPGLDALDAGRSDRLVLVAGGRTGAATWEATRPGLLGRLFPRRATFASPPRDDA